MNQQGRFAEAEPLHREALGRRHPPLEPRERALARHPLLHEREVELQELRELSHRRALRLARVDEDRIRLRALRERQPLRVDDRPAARRQRELAQVLVTGPLTELVALPHLQMHGARHDDGQEREEHGAAQPHPEPDPSGRACVETGHRLGHSRGSPCVTGDTPYSFSFALAMLTVV